MADVPDAAHKRYCRILSVSADNRMLLTRNHALSVAGYAVASPRFVEQTRDLVASQQFDAVIIGDSVPVETRNSIIADVRAIRPNLKVVFVYASASESGEPLADFSINAANDPSVLIDALKKHHLGD